MKRSFTRPFVAIALAALFVLTSACGLLSSPTGPSSAPVVKIFTSDASRIVNGQSTTLRWEVEGDDVTCRIDPQVGNGLPATGNVEVRPSGSPGTQWIYTLACSNKHGDVNRTLTILVG